MDKMKRYIDAYIPTETCNFRCHYCYITQQRKFNNKLAKFDYTPEFIAKALSQKRLGGPCLINLCAGGETLLIEELIPIVEALLKEGHYIMIVTNGSLSVRFDQIIKMPKELLKRLSFKFSFHYLELKRLKKLEEFFNNIRKIKNAGASFTVEITPNDELIPYIDEIKQVSMKNLGALPHITIARNDVTKNIAVLSKYDYEEYKKIWSTFDSDLFKFKSEIFYKKRKEFCYAGDWSLYLNLATGDVRQCYYGLNIGNIYKNIDEPIETLAVGNTCTSPHCYNGHAFLTLGCIPEMKTPTYAVVRNRKCADGTEWLNETMKSFISTKLVESNVEYYKQEKQKVNLQNKKLRVARKINALSKKIKNKK